MIQSISTTNFTTTDLDRLAQELNRDGICVIRGLFDRGLIEEWAQAGFPRSPIQMSSPIR